MTLNRGFSIGEIPIYVRAGSIIPMQPPMSYTGEKPVDPLILTVFPLENGQTSKYRLYEDAGDTPGYKHGECAWTPIRASLSADGTALTLTVAPLEGRYKGMPAARAYQVRLPGSWPPSSVSVDGAPMAYSKKMGSQAGWRFEGDTLTTIINTQSFPVGDTATITVKIKPELARNRAMLEGFAGKMARLRETYDILNGAWPVAWSPDALIEAMQTGDRIGDYPGTAFAELSALPAKLAGLAGAINAMRATAASPAFAKKSEDKNHPAPSLADYNRLVDTALAHLADINAPQPAR